MNVYRSPNAHEQLLGLWLVGQIAVFVLHQLGYPTLHASAVVAERGTAVFLGSWGHGKSTMAASFLRRGARLLTDDVLPLESRDDGVYGRPGLPLMKLWPEAAERALDVSDELPTMLDGYDKRLLTFGGRFDLAEAPSRLSAIYVLNRYDLSQVGPGTESDGIAIRRLSGREGLFALFEQISSGAFLQPAEIGRFMPLYTRLLKQAPVRVLSFPSGFEHQEAVFKAVLSDLAAPA